MKDTLLQIVDILRQDVLDGKVLGFQVENGNLPGEAIGMRYVFAIDAPDRQLLPSI